MYNQTYKHLSHIVTELKLSFFMRGGFLLVLYGMLLLTACMSDDEYTTSPNDRLAFSTDTISFDTVFSGQPTTTVSFVVYNPAGKNIRLKNAYLEGGGNSVFRVNVDGVFLENGRLSDSEVEIAAKDSMRVFVMANIAEQGIADVRRWADKLVLQTEGGAEGSVVLEACSRDAKRLSALVLNEDTVFSSELPYIVKDSLVIGENATLTLSAGCQLFFSANASLIVRGTLHAEGTQSEKVLMRGERTDYMFPNQPYDRVPGQWGGVVFKEESHDNRLNYCDIHSGEYGVRCEGTGDVSQEKLRIENTILHNMSGDGLFAKASKVFIGNSQITNCGGNCVTLQGGDNTFVHTTIGNFYVFTGGRGKALYYTNYNAEEALPLHRAAFLNCIVTGYSDDEIIGDASVEYAETPFEFFFQNCLLDTPPVSDERIVNCFWDKKAEGNEVWREDNFSPEFDLKRLIFSFTLNEKSQAVGNADLAISRQYYPLDMNGVNRLDNDAPDIGCFEYQGKEEEK